MPTIVQRIAERAGVSPSTVTRILNGEVSYRRPFYAERARRIRALAAELNYRPNMAARAVSTGRFDTLCLVASSSGRGGLPLRLVDGMVERATDQGRLLTQARLPDEGFTDPEGLPSILRSAMADGLLINYTHGWPEGLEAAIGAAGVPAVWVNARRAHDCIHFADREAARDTTRRLIALGHRRIAFLHFGADPRREDPSLHYSSRDRWQGYQQAMGEASLEPQALIEPGRFALADLRESRVITAALQAPARPTALITSALADAVAFTACSLGLRLPQDLCIVHFARNFYEAQAMPIVRLALPQSDLGRRAVDYLLARIEEPDRPRTPEAIPVPLQNEACLVPPGETAA